jgi:hypothetical protein
LFVCDLPERIRDLITRCIRHGILAGSDELMDV